MNYELKPIKEEEYLKLFELLAKNRSRLQRYFPNTIKEIATKEDSRKHLKDSDLKRNKKEKYLLGIYDEENLIGYINVKNIEWEVPKCEIGYFIDEDYEGKGIMTKQIKKTVDYCFNELGMMKIYLRIGKENEGSRIIAKKTGFEKEGILRKEFRTETGELIDLEYYGIVNENY